MLCYMVCGLLPHFLPVLLPWRLVGISQSLPFFSCISAGISCLALPALPWDKVVLFMHNERITYPTRTERSSHSIFL